MKQDRSCLVFFPALGCPRSSLGKTDTSSWSPNCALGSRLPSDAPQRLLCLGARRCCRSSRSVFVVLDGSSHAGEQDGQGLRHGHSQMSCPCSLLATTLPRESPQAEQPPNCLTIAYVKTDTGKEGMRGTDPGSSGRQVEGQEPMYIYISHFQMRSVRINVVPVLSANQKSSAKAPLMSCHHLPHPSAEQRSTAMARQALATGKKYLQNESEYSPPSLFLALYGLHFRANM